MSPKELLWRNRLAEWEDELRTNRYGMAYLAPRAVALLQAEIIEFWGRAAPRRRIDVKERHYGLIATGFAVWSAFCFDRGYRAISVVLLMWPLAYVIRALVRDMRGPRPKESR